MSKNTRAFLDDISCCLKLIKFARAQVKFTWAQALVDPVVDTPLNHIEFTNIYLLICIRPGPIDIVVITQ